MGEVLPILAVVESEAVGQPRRRVLRSCEPPESVTPEISDEAIIEGLIAGENWAADALYDRTISVVERTLRRVLHPADGDSDDLVQITFERVVRTLLERKFSGACSLSTWASAIAGHVAIDALRARTRERGVFGAEHVLELRTLNHPARPDLGNQLEARSDVEQLQEVLAGMKPDQAKTVVLHDALGHDLAEIAVMMGVSVSAAQSRLVRGRKELLKRARARIKTR